MRAVKRGLFSGGLAAFIRSACKGEAGAGRRLLCCLVSDIAGGVSSAHASWRCFRLGFAALGHRARCLQARAVTDHSLRDGGRARPAPARAENSSADGWQDHRGYVERICASHSGLQTDLAAECGGSVVVSAPSVRILLEDGVVCGLGSQLAFTAASTNSRFSRTHLVRGSEV